MKPEALRAEFPVFERLAYLNAGSNGPVPRRAVESALVMMRTQLEEGRGGRPFFDQIFASATALRDRVAGLLGCEAGELVLMRSTTDGVNTVLGGLALGPGDEVLTSDEEHPGMQAPLAIARRRCGFDLRIVPFAEIAGAVGPNTKLVATCHVSWVSGQVLDAAAIDAPLLLDGAQGLRSFRSTCARSGATTTPPPAEVALWPGRLRLSLRPPGARGGPGGHPGRLSVPGRPRPCA